MVITERVRLKRFKKVPNPRLKKFHNQGSKKFHTQGSKKCFNYETFYTFTILFDQKIATSSHKKFWELYMKHKLLTHNTNIEEGS